MDNMSKSGLLVALLAFVLSSCAHVTGSKGPPDGLKMLIEPAVRAVYYDTQVVIGDCPHAHEIAPLLATVGAATVAQGVSRIGDALRSEERRVGKECVSTCRSRRS